MGKKRNGGLANIGAVLRAAEMAAPKSGEVVDPIRHKRQLVADLCRLLEPLPASHPVHSHTLISAPVPPAAAPELPRLSPRMRQTLERLLAGDSEKQIATRLAVSRHTIHVYVKALYKGFGVCSRGELLARFVSPPTIQSIIKSSLHS